MNPFPSDYVLQGWPFCQGIALIWDSNGDPVLFVSINHVISITNNEIDKNRHMIRNSNIAIFRYSILR